MRLWKYKESNNSSFKRGIYTKLWMFAGRSQEQKWCIDKKARGLFQNNPGIFPPIFSLESMKDRCENPNCHAYSDYGARGISVCEEWHDFIVFKKWAIKNGYDKDAPYGQCTIDRKDNDKGYCPENCRFITMREQTMNRRSNRSKDGRYRKADCRHGST